MEFERIVLSFIVDFSSEFEDIVLITHITHVTHDKHVFQRTELRPPAGTLCICMFLCSRTPELHSHTFSPELDPLLEGEMTKSPSEALKDKTRSIRSFVPNIQEIRVR